MTIINNIVKYSILYFVMLISLNVLAQTPEKGMQFKSDLKDTALSNGLIQGTRWALLIGIADYPSSPAFDVQNLQSPVKDVNALAEFLKDPQKGGFEADHVFVLTNENADRRNILINFNEIAKKVAKDDMVIFFFSGHGYNSGGVETTYLITYDYDLRDCETTCINFDDLSKKIQKMDASKVLVILDTCHAGGVKPKGSRDAGANVVSRYTEAFKNASGRYMLLSSDEGEVSWETSDNGIFTRFLLEGLNGEADKDSDGIVTYTEVANYVEITVPEYTRRNFSKEQKPTRRGDLGGAQRGDIPLAINMDVVNKLRLDEIRSKRKSAILLAGLDTDLKEFSLKAIQSAYDKTLKGEEVTRQESILLDEIDALKSEKIPPAEFADRARIIYNAVVKPANIAKIVAKELPEGARVFVNDSQITLPHQLPPGTYRIRVERDGFQPFETTESLNTGQTLSIGSIKWTTPPKQTGTLKLSINPYDAKVTLFSLNTSDMIDLSQKDIGEIPVGYYRVTAEKEGYETIVKDRIEITANTPVSLPLILKLKPTFATIAYADMPQGTRVFVNDLQINLPYQAQPGVYSIRLEREGFETINVSQTLVSKQTLSLNPDWVQIKKPIDKPLPIKESIKKPSRFNATAFGKSLVIPGLGQHSSGYKKRGIIYEAIVLGVGITAISASYYHHVTIENFNNTKYDINEKAPNQTELTSELRALLDDQNRYYDRSKTTRVIAIASQVAFGIAWGINAFDAGFIGNSEPNNGQGLGFQPTSNGGELFISMSF